MSREYTDSSITTLDGLVHMRKHPGMWGFDKDSQQGPYQLIKEVFDNAVDEASIDSGRQHVINLTILRQTNTYQILLEDSGRGIPLFKLKDVFTALFTSAKDDKAYSKTIGTYGVGVKATTALSRVLTAVSCRGDGYSIVSTNKAVCTNSNIVKKKNKDESSYGTTVLFEPDTSILSQAKHFFDENGGFDDLMNLIEFICMIYKNITVNIYMDNGKVLDKDIPTDPVEAYHFLKNIKNTVKLHYVSSNTTTPVEYMKKRYGLHSEVIWHSGIYRNDQTDTNLDYHVEFFVTKDYTNRNSNMVSSINAIQMYDKKAVQFEGCVDAIKLMLAEQIDEKDLRSYFLSTYTLPIHIVTLAWWDKATFKNQSKDTFRDAKFLEVYFKLLTKQFKRLDQEYWDKLYTLLAEDIEAKYHKYNSRGLNLGGSMKNMAYNLNKPGSYCACRLKDPEKIELFIVEGDSAMTTIKQVCDRDTQALIMLGGKPLNPFKKDTSEARKNLVHQDLITVIGVGPGDKDLRNMNFSRIGILADADLNQNGSLC